MRVVVEVVEVEGEREGVKRAKYDDQSKSHPEYSTVYWIWTWVFPALLLLPLLLPLNLTYILYFHVALLFG